jgi:hypothetical protein
VTSSSRRIATVDGGKGGVVGAGPTTLLLLACMVVNYVLGPPLEPDDGDVESTRRRQLLVGDQSYATGR